MAARGLPRRCSGPDRVPLLALLRDNARLTEDQIEEVVRDITDAESRAATNHKIDYDEFATFIADYTHHGADEEHQARVGQAPGCSPTRSSAGSR